MINNTELIDKIKSYNKFLNSESLNKAYNFALDAHQKEDNAITFKCVKMRNGEETDFTSTMDWATLKIGPETGRIQTEEESDEDPYDI